MAEGSDRGASAQGSPRGAAAGYGWSDLIIAGLIFVFSQWAAALIYGMFGGTPPAADAEGAGFLRGRYLAAVYTIAMVLCVTLLALYGRIMGRSARLTFRAPGWASPIRLLSGYLLLWCFSIAVEPLASMLPGRDGDMGTGGWFLLCSIVVAPLFEEIIFRGFLTGGMRRAYGGVAAWICPAVVFAAVHVAPAAMVTALSVMPAASFAMVLPVQGAITSTSKSLPGPTRSACAMVRMTSRPVISSSRRMWSCARPKRLSVAAAVSLMSAVSSHSPLSRSAAARAFS